MDQYIGPAVWVAVLLFEIWSAQHRSRWTISHLVKTIFRTDEKTGRVVFAVTWTGFAAWFLWHILA